MQRTARGHRGRLIDVDTGALRKDRVLLQQGNGGYFCIGLGPRAANICDFAFSDALSSTDPFFSQCQRIDHSIDSRELAKTHFSNSQLPPSNENKFLRRLALAEALAKAGFNPEQLRDRRGRWAREGGGDFLVPLSAPATPSPSGSQTQEPLRLPPGKRIDELGDFLEWIANSKPEDEPALRREVKRLFYDVGDIWGGNAMNAAISNAMESSSRVERQAILDTYEPYTREDPAEVGQTMRDIVSSILLFPGSALLPREIPPAAGGVATQGVTLPTYLTRLSDVWKLGWAARGWAVEDALGANLPRWFPTIDKFADGVVTSIKSIDLSAAVYGDAGRLSARIDAYVDKVAEFNGITRGSTIIESEQIQGRALHLAIPADGGTAIQRAAIEASAARAKTLGVDVLVTKF